jgi:hypothetical protein
MKSLNKNPFLRKGPQTTIMTRVFYAVHAVSSVVHMIFVLTYVSRIGQESWSHISTRPEIKNDCAGEGDEKCNTPTVSSIESQQLS